jgi:hypothetical protein
MLAVTLLVVWGLSSLALAQGFTFAIGGPAASQDFKMKAAVFAFRTEGCADPANALVSGTAEGFVNGMRQSRPLQVVKASKPGVYGVFQNWSGEGVWVVNLKGTCGNQAAGAIVPLGPKGFIRESSKFLARPATNAEISDSLKALLNGGTK